MPNKELLRQLEIEKQRRNMNRPQGYQQMPLQGEEKYAWEYELEAYRVQRKQMKWLMVAAFFGPVSFLIEVAVHGPQWMAWLQKIWFRG